MSDRVSVALWPRDPSAKPPDHWIGNPPTRFRNPWPSYRATHSLVGQVKVRFGSDRNFVPVPDDPTELVTVQTPDWGAGQQCSRVTWLGHASFFAELCADEGQTDQTDQTDPEQTETEQTDRKGKRGVRLLLDPVFSLRMGPRNLVGPRRFVDRPCRLEDVPLVDAVCVSHNHYDHMDVDTLRALVADPRRTAPLRVFCTLGSRAWFRRVGVADAAITEMDWWDEATLTVAGVGAVRIACTPAQHVSRRGAWDQGRMLWCSWVLGTGARFPCESSADAGATDSDSAPTSRTTAPGTTLFFAGDTGYRSITQEDLDAGTDPNTLPCCPAFRQIGARYGPFALALLPIGCYSPRTFMSGVHCAPEDAVALHADLRARRSLAMHYGTIRGALSAQYEDVREPPLRWRKACEAAGRRWGDELFVCNIGETVPFS